MGTQPLPTKPMTELYSAWDHRAYHDTLRPTLEDVFKTTSLSVCFKVGECFEYISHITVPLFADVTLHFEITNTRIQASLDIMKYPNGDISKEHHTGLELGNETDMLGYISLIAEWKQTQLPACNCTTLQNPIPARPPWFPLDFPTCTTIWINFEESIFRINSDTLEFPLSLALCQALNAI